MTLVSSFAAVVLVSGAPIAVDALSTEGRNQVNQNGHAASGFERRHQEYFAEGSQGIMLSSSTCVENRGGATSRDPSRWHGLCGGRAYRDCVLTHPVPILCLVLLLLGIGLGVLARWWHCCARRVFSWRYSVGNVSGGEDDGIARYRDVAMDRRRLLSGRHSASLDASESRRAMHGATGNAFLRFNIPFHANNSILLRAGLWGPLQYAPVALLRAPAPLTGSIEEPHVTESIVVECGSGVTANAKDFCTRLRDDDRMPPDSTGASDLEPQVDGTLLSVTRAASSGDSHDYNSQRDAKSFEDSMCDRRCSCQSDCSSDERTGVECPAFRDTAGEACESLFWNRADVLPQSIYFNINADAKGHIRSCESGNRGTDSQQPCDGLVPNIRSTASTASGESSSHTPPPPTDTPELSRRGSGSTLCAYDADASCDTVCTGATLAHEATAILDPEVTPHASWRTADDLHESGFSPHALPSCEALSSTMGPHINDLEYVAPPLAHASTAASSPALHEASCLPVHSPIAAAILAPGSLNSELVMLDSVGTEEAAKGATPGASYGLTLQLQRSPANAPPKRRSKRRSPRYCEPWQPVLASCKVTPVAAAAATATLSAPSTPSSPACDWARQNTGTCAVENDLEDLMLADGVLSAESSVAGDGTCVFSGGSVTILRTHTLAAEIERGTTTTPLVMATVYGRGASLCSNLAPSTPLAAASDPLRPTSPMPAVRPRTAGAVETLVSKCGERSSVQCCGPSQSVGQRPSLNLSVEERALLLRSKSWLFPLIDGTDEIEQGD
ncbi:hypothetical protein LSCM1_01001 [Leishmania martiniquensis]|uniref:Proteophosphoglycan ppg4 n=1 Tax=Leishmania martiniquensis TaxID=1580590 RepID=A0A836G7E1_9TRYP|nr:hypothetical protein LSCM1_01001 [Leishmania martiniquensis]